MKATITVGTKERAVLTWTLKAGAFDQSQAAYESHQRGKNWVATVVFAPMQPGGLDRDFWKRGSGSYVQPPSELAPGNFIEVASDYYSGSGRKNASRHYFRVLAVAADRIIVRESGSPPEKPRDITIEIADAELVDPVETTKQVAVHNPLAGYSVEELSAEIMRRNNAPKEG